MYVGIITNFQHYQITVMLLNRDFWRFLLYACSILIIQGQNWKPTPWRLNCHRFSWVDTKWYAIGSVSKVQTSRIKEIPKSWECKINLLVDCFQPEGGCHQNKYTLISFTEVKIAARTCAYGRGGGILSVQNNDPLSMVEKKIAYFYALLVVKQ